jgi:proline iminopeptidase
MPQPIPAARAEGTTTSTTAPLYWARHGKAGADPLLVLHGGPGASHDYLLPQMLRLGSAHDLLFYDQRGGGRSRTDDQAPVTWQVQVDDLAAVVTEFALDPLTLVGYSWGGLLALLYLVAATEGRVRRPARLVLIDPAPASRTWREQFEATFQQRQSGVEIQAMREELAQSGLRESDPAAHRQRAFELSVAGYFADATRARDLTPFRVTGRVQQSVWESLGDFDLVPSLERAVKVPTLLVHGWHDPIPVESSLAVARALHARCVVLEASGHVPYVEQPDTLFETIEQFLRETS